MFTWASQSLSGREPAEVSMPQPETVAVTESYAELTLVGRHTGDASFLNFISLHSVRIEKSWSVESL